MGNKEGDEYLIPPRGKMEGKLLPISFKTMKSKMSKTFINTRSGNTGHFRFTSHINETFMTWRELHSVIKDKDRKFNFFVLNELAIGPSLTKHIPWIGDELRKDIANFK